MQLVVHSPYGSRINRAWGLALQETSPQFDFNCSAARPKTTSPCRSPPRTASSSATSPAICIRPRRGTVLIQAMLDAPMFQTRWRRVAVVSLACRVSAAAEGAAATGPDGSEHLVASVCPDHIACARIWSANARCPTIPSSANHRRLPDRGDGHRRVGTAARLAMSSGAVRITARDLTEPSPLALEVLSAPPYAYLDDLPPEERRTQAVIRRGATSRWKSGIELAGSTASHRPRARRSVARGDQRRRAPRRARLARLPDRGWRSRRRRAAGPAGSASCRGSRVATDGDTCRLRCG